MIFNPIVVGGNKEYTISDSTGYSFPATASGGEYIESSQVRDAGYINAQTESGKRVGMTRHEVEIASGFYAYYYTFFMPAENIEIR